MSEDFKDMDEVERSTRRKERIKDCYGLMAEQANKCTSMIPIENDIGKSGREKMYVTFDVMIAKVEDVLSDLREIDSYEDENTL